MTLFCIHDTHCWNPFQLINHCVKIDFQIPGNAGKYSSLLENNPAYPGIISRYLEYSGIFQDMLEIFQPTGKYSSLPWKLIWWNNFQDAGKYSSLCWNKFQGTRKLRDYAGKYSSVFCNFKRWKKKPLPLIFSALYSMWAWKTRKVVANTPSGKCSRDYMENAGNFFSRAVLDCIAKESEK